MSNLANASATDAIPGVWTAFLDHRESEQMHILMAHVCCAHDAGDARRQFAEAFERRFAPLCMVERGVARNGVTLMLWSEGALDLLEQLHAWGDVEATSSLQFGLVRRATNPSVLRFRPSLKSL